MLSFSDNEMAVINFLVRNFTEKLTIRSIAQRLKFSAAGVFNILKKLEQERIVVGERLGTGLFYSINFESKIAEHLAFIMLLYSEEIPKANLEQIKSAKAAILSKKNLLLVSSLNSLEIPAPELHPIVKSEEELIELFRKKDPAVLQILKDGTVLFGEEIIIGIIKKSISRF